MFAFETGSLPVTSPRALFARFAAVAAAFGLAGCSATTSHLATETAIKNVAVAQAVDVEADGRPAQTAPSPRLRALPDEPAEPFSKNYGGKNPSAEKRFEPVQQVNAPSQSPPKIPLDLPPAFRKHLMQAMAENE
jgi:hypothetical protein